MRLKGIRFDYRLHLMLDRHEDLAENAKLKQLGNQAGVFADSDSAGFTFEHAFVHAKSRSGISRGAFDAVEKPLVMEIYAPGLIKGVPNTKYLAKTDPAYVKDLRGWDNIHWWADRGRGGSLPSTPGAFHAVHVHWRWGAAIAIVTKRPPFNPNSWPDDFGSSNIPVRDFAPLVDPNIFMQTLQIAVTRNSPRLDPAQRRNYELTEDDWSYLFTSLRSDPWPIKDGNDIVLWYTTEVHREVAMSGSFFDYDVESVNFIAKPGGTVFLHGLFFAHDPEPDPSFFTNVSLGSSDEMYRPRSEAEAAKAGWQRPASD
jgi:hypothetical protein